MRFSFEDRRIFHFRFKFLFEESWSSELFSPYVWCVRTTLLWNRPRTMMAFKAGGIKMILSMNFKL
jgi:hypothetical protein